MLIMLLIAVVLSCGTVFISEFSAFSLRKQTLQYKQMDGVSANLLSADIYYTNYARNDSLCPAIIMVHGGGLVSGDKAEAAVAQNKSKYYVKNGYVFVSINHRLSPAVTHPAHVQDVADAVMYIYNNAEAYGIDKNRLFIMGHSAGAHMAVLLATNDKYIKQAGGDLSIIKGVISVDTLQYNTARTSNYPEAIGTDDAAFRDASALNFVSSGKGIPPHLLFYSDEVSPYYPEYVAPFVTKLNNNNIPAAAVYAKGDNHGSINATIGVLGDLKTQIIDEFLQNPADVVEIANRFFAD